MTKLYEHQKEVLDKIKPGSILCGGVGTGKSLVAVSYFKKCFDKRDLIIITTAKKRDSLDWEKECAPFTISTKRDCSLHGIKLTVDSWNNIKKYTKTTGAFFIFDEQRLVGSGAWVKSFLKIAKKNKWILLSATPGDTWLDYIPVFVAHNFYKNRTEFLREHAVYCRWVKFPKIERYIDQHKLIKYKKQILVEMHYNRHTTRHNTTINTQYSKEDYKRILKDRWDIYQNKPIKHISQVCYLLRKVVNSSPSRVMALEKLLSTKDRAIIFYNFDYELEIIKDVCVRNNLNYAEWNGHKHQQIPKTKKWVYIVQYIAGAEGWNCVETNNVIFYSQNYSYKILEQSSGRIDRLNTEYINLYYYHLKSQSSIDLAIEHAIKKKKLFNANTFMNY